MPRNSTHSARRRFVAAFLSVPLALALPASVGPAAAATTVRVAAINQSDMLALYVGADQGLFEKRGIKLEVIPVANSSVVVSSLVAGSADVGFTVPPTIIQAKDAGIDLVVVAGATEFPLPKPAYAGIVARNGSNIRAASDLVGKKVGVIGLTAFHHIMARRWLTENGVQPDRVNFVEVGLPQAPDLMKSGQLDAAVSVDPFYNRMIGENVGYAMDDYLKTVPDGMPVDFYVAQKAWADKNKEAVREFKAAIGEAIALIKSDEAGARASLAKWTKLPAPVIASTRIPNFADSVRPGTMDWWVDLMRKQDLVGGDIKGADFLLP